MKRIAASTLCLVLFVPRLTEAKEDVASERGGQLYSIEKRDLMGHHEISLSVGALPLDAFFKGVTLSGIYAYHFNHLIAWEIIGGVYSFNSDTGLEQELKDRFDVQPEREGQLDALMHSDFVFKPFYGKVVLANDLLFSAELFFVAGPAIGFYETGARPFGVNYGAGLRTFIGRYFSVRFDIRDYMLFPGFSSIENNLYMSLGLSLTFGFADDLPENE